MKLRARSAASTGTDKDVSVVVVERGCWKYAVQGVTGLLVVGERARKVVGRPISTGWDFVNILRWRDNTSCPRHRISLVASASWRRRTSTSVITPLVQPQHCNGEKTRRARRLLLRWKFFEHDICISTAPTARHSRGVNTDVTNYSVLVGPKFYATSSIVPRA